MSSCSQCHYENNPDALLCNLCGHLLHKEPASLSVEESDVSPPVVQKKDTSPLFVQKSWKQHYLQGFILSLLLWAPNMFSKGISWYISALFHESGHALASWYLGSVAIPAAGLGHGVTLTLNQSTLLTCAVWLVLGLATLYFLLRKRQPLFLTLLVMFISYPLLAFTSVRELLITLAGHGGEVLFCTLFFWRAAMLSHKVMEHERTLYACLAWVLWINNLVFFYGLTYSDDAYNTYLSNGSFGLANDFVRVANTLGTSVSEVAFRGLTVTLLFPFLGLWWAYIGFRGHMKPQASPWGEAADEGQRFISHLNRK